MFSLFRGRKKQKTSSLNQMEQVGRRRKIFTQVPRDKLKYPRIRASTACKPERSRCNDGDAQLAPSCVQQRRSRSTLRGRQNTSVVYPRKGEQGTTMPLQNHATGPTVTPSPRSNPNARTRESGNERAPELSGNCRDGYLRRGKKFLDDGNRRLGRTRTLERTSVRTLERSNSRTPEPGVAAVKAVPALLRRFPRRLTSEETPIAGRLPASQTFAAA